MAERPRATADSKAVDPNGPPDAERRRRQRPVLRHGCRHSRGRRRSNVARFCGFAGFRLRSGSTGRVSRRIPALCPAERTNRPVSSTTRTCTWPVALSCSWIAAVMLAPSDASSRTQEFGDQAVVEGNDFQANYQSTESPQSGHPGSSSSSPLTWLGHRPTARRLHGIGPSPNWSPGRTGSVPWKSTSTIFSLWTSPPVSSLSVLTILRERVSITSPVEG